MRVVGLWRYPVKSMLGEAVDAAEMGPTGLLGDRAYGIVDVATGKVLTARREPHLLFASASWHDGEVAMVTSDGERLDSDRALSAWLGRPVRLTRAGEEGGVYEAPEDEVTETDWSSWQGPGHAWHDSGRTRVSLLSTATLGAWPLQRFRANVLLDGADEDALVGTRVRLGTALLDVTKRISRCVMITRAQPGIETDREVLRTIHRERGGQLAIGALVADGGAVAVGDELDAAG